MADTHTSFSNDLGTDTSAFEDVQPTTGQRSEGAPGGDPQQETQQSQQPSETEIPAELKGTPFKSHVDLANGYRNLQKLVSSKDREFQDLKRSTQELIRSLAGQAQGKPSPQAVTKEDADAFLKKFLADPVGTLKAAVDGTLTDALKQHLDPIRNDLGETKLERQIERFMSGGGKDLTPEQQTRFLEILEEDAELVNSAKDPLGLALRLLRSEFPAGSDQATKDTATQTLRDAKSAASGLGGKHTSIHQAGKKQDEFDEVLSLHKGLVPGR